MTLFTFNENSVLNNGFSRTINAVCLFALLACGFAMDNDMVVSPKIFLLIPFATSVLSVFITYHAYIKTDFYEWDYTERQKKKRFVFTYFFVCGILSAMFVYSVIIEYFIITKTDGMIVVKWLGAIPIVLFVFNLCNIPSLFRPLFMDDLTVCGKIQDKPKNWKDDGPEMNEYEAAKDILHRDFNI